MGYLAYEGRGEGDIHRDAAFHEVPRFGLRRNRWCTSCVRSFCPRIGSSNGRLFGALLHCRDKARDGSLDRLFRTCKNAPSGSMCYRQNNDRLGCYTRDRGKVDRCLRENPDCLPAARHGVVKCNATANWCIPPHCQLPIAKDMRIG